MPPELGQGLPVEISLCTIGLFSTIPPCFNLQPEDDDRLVYLRSDLLSLMKDIKEQQGMDNP